MGNDFDRLIDAEEFEKAARILEPLVEAENGPYERFRLGVCYYRLANFKNSSAVLRPLVEAGGEFAREAQMVIAYSLKSLKRWREAAFAFEQVLTLGRNTPDERRTVKVLMAACWEEVGDWVKALEIYKDLGITGTERDEEILLRRAAVHEKLLEWSEAERLYEDFIQRFSSHPDHVRALFKRAQIFYEQGRFSRALEEFERLSSMEPPTFLTEIAKEFVVKSRAALEGSMKAARRYETRH